MVIAMFSYKRFTLNKKLAIIPVVAIVPMIVLAVYLLLTASYTTNAYADITNNVVQANKYVQDFKERVDYTMYLSVIKNKTIDEMQVGKVTVNGILTVNPYQYITEFEQIRRLKNTLGSLRNCVEELEKCINDRNSYDKNMQYLDNNIYVLTSLVQSGIENYIYVETTNFENVKAQLNKKNKQDIWIAVITAIIAVAVSTVLSIRAAYSVTGPIKNLCAMTSKVAEGDFTAKSKKVESQDEIAVLVRNFNDMTKEIGSLVDDMKKNHEMLRMIEMKLLQAQINPHFLYNTLDTAVWLAESNQNDQVVTILTYLSDFFRTTLSNGQSFIRIAEEQKHVESFRDILDYTIDIEENIEEYIIPKLLLQPLVENAIVHGIRNKRGNGHVRIEGRQKEDKIVFYVSDDGRGMTTEDLAKLKKRLKEDEEVTQESGFGVVNVNQRIHSYYGEEYGIFYESREGKGTKVTVVIPAKNVSDVVL